MTKWLIAALCVSSLGCVSYDSAGADAHVSSDVPEPQTPTGPVTPTVPDSGSGDACGAESRAAYDAIDRSVHELITCGGMQVSLAQSMVAILLLSNERMFDEQSKNDLQQIAEYLPRNEFDQIDDGQWRIAMSTSSTFDLEFREPHTGARIYEDVFDMQSYLVGLQATYDHTLTEMMEQPDLENRWVFTWDELGPLAHLLNGGAEVPREFELALTLNELLDIIFPYWATGTPDLGVFQSLLDIEMGSTIRLRDQRQTSSGSAQVDYEILAAGSPVGAIADSGQLEFAIVDLAGTVGATTFEATDSEVGYSNGLGALSGVIHLRSRDADVEMDFGTGSAYPTARWTCDE